MLSPFRAEGYGNTIPVEIHRALNRDRPPPELYVSTTGTGADWVVKLIDVYPDDAPDPKNNPANIRLGGY
jgi:hypothetical protein